MRARAATKSLPEAVWVSATTANELEALARRVGRSVAFVVERALAAAKLPGVGIAAPGETSLVLAVDDDDPEDLRARIARRARAGGGLDVAVEAAWRATRARFLAWAAREEAARGAECADDLDAALAAARAPSTSSAQLGLLAASVYPRVRALVAAHPATDAATLARLAADRERCVREALAQRLSGS